MVRTCCVCKAEPFPNTDVSFHRIPKNEETKIKWFINLGDQEINQHSSVCSQHFQEDDFIYKSYAGVVKRFLTPNAVPSLCITQFDSENAEHSNITEKQPSAQESVVLPLENHNINHNSPSTSEDLSSNVIEHHVVTDSVKDSALSNIKKLNDSREFITEFIKVESLENLTDDDSVVTDETQSDVEDVQNDKDTEGRTLKRICSEPKSREKRLLSNPRYIGDLRREDFTSDVSWHIVDKYVKQSKKKQKVLNQKVRRLSKRMESLSSMLDHLKEIGSLSSEGHKALKKSLNNLK